ncbi:MAG: hypothetical protein LBS54_03975 [Dysgonamonadaceae bacterium]|nr:hypothetical protein [Dysgonamonadaceae bacterium]
MPAYIVVACQHTLSLYPYILLFVISTPVAANPRIFALDFQLSSFFITFAYTEPTTAYLPFYAVHPNLYFIRPFTLSALEVPGDPVAALLCVIPGRADTTGGHCVQSLRILNPCP